MSASKVRIEVKIHSSSIRRVSMDRYELKEELGDGSFGRVMKAQHKKTGDVVSKKSLIALMILPTRGKSKLSTTYPIVVRFFLFTGRNQAYQTQDKVLECNCGFTRSTKLTKIVPSEHRENDGSNPREVTSIYQKYSPTLLFPLTK